MITIQTPYVQFNELDGSPLDDGAVYIGTAGLNPQTNPITVYWDNAGTQPAAQPLSTRSGVIARNGAPARVYISASSYSLMVRDKRGRLVASELSITSSVDASGITDGTITEVKLDAALVAKINGALQTTGGTMTGAIVLPGNATNSLEAVPKQQAESIAATAVSNRFQYNLTMAQSTSTGSAVDFTAIPAWAKRITLSFRRVSLSGADLLVAVLGTSSGFVSSGYEGCYQLNTIASPSNAQGGVYGVNFAISANNTAVDIRHGIATLVHMGFNVWAISGTSSISNGTGNVSHFSGSVELPSELDRIRFTSNGASTFDGGSVSLLVEG